DRIVITAQGRPGRVVLNTSLGYATPVTPAVARSDGSNWAAAIRAAGLEGRLLHATAGGEDPPIIKTTDDSRWDAAVLHTDLFDPATGNHANPLSNTLVVESLADSGAPA